MTAFVHNTNVVLTTTAPVFTLVGGDTLTLASGSSLVQTAFVTTGTGTVRTSGTTSISNAGYLSNVGNAIYNSSGALTLSNTGFIKGGSTGDTRRLAGVYIEEGAVSITNSGSIVSDVNHAIVNAGSAVGVAVTINNSGLIAAYGALAAIATSFTSPTNITNSGTIFGGIGFDRYTTAGAAQNQSPLTLNNTATGTIVGSVNRLVGTEPGITGTGATTDSIQNAGVITGDVILGKSVDSLVNTGTINGNVDLGIDNDTYTTSGSYGVVRGSIIGGLGDDTITGGFSRDVIYGDNVSGDTTGGIDTLSGGYGDDVVYGGYGADVLYGNQDADVLYGNQDADFLFGGQGNDSLYGGQGVDTLNGNVGNDVLFGNLGDDAFVFAAGFGQDRIGDLGAVQGNADIIRFGAGTFADFADVQARASNQAEGVLLTAASGDTVLIVGYTAAQLMSGQFAFG